MTKRRWFKDKLRQMANTAFLSSRNVSCCFSERQSAVVTGAASTIDFLVIDFALSNRPTGSGHVTGLALVRGIDVARGFSSGIGPVVARQAIAGIHAGMIKTRFFPSRSLVANVALFGGHQMLHRLTGCDSAVVAAGANAENLAVIDGNTPFEINQSCRMARLAHISRCHMGRVLARRQSAIMATDTHAKYFVMVGLLRH